MLPKRRRRTHGLAALALLTLGHRKKDREKQTPLFIFHVVKADPTNQQHQASNNEEGDLPRPLNYYELLDLETPNTHRRSKAGKLHTRKKRAVYRARITKDQIKKAYRKQAQLFHPDKASRHNMTTGEATSRFTEIAEAFQALIDPVQRYDHDYELLELEEEYEEELNEQREQKQKQRQHQRYEGGQRIEKYDSSLYEKIRNGAANFQNWKDSLNVDPWAVFEEFFFEDSMSDANINPGTEDYRYHQAQSNTFEGRYHPRPPSPSHSQMPPRVSETTIHRGYDASFGADVFSVLRREEHVHDVLSNTWAYQIHGQDFISGKRVDPYTGFTMQEYYSAVTEPYFVEKGYSKQSSGGGNNNYAHAKFRRNENEQKATTPRVSPSLLRVGESITPNIISQWSASDLWISQNEKYQAILTRTCELQIVLCGEQQNQTRTSPMYDDVDDESKIIWSSETYIPDVRAQGCHLTLKSNGRLVLSVDYGSGLNSVDNTVLWNSRIPPVVPHWVQDKDTNMNQQPITFWYYASLDNDGVIAVYRVEDRLEDSNASQSEKLPITNFQGIKSKLQIRAIIDKLGVTYHRISKTSVQQGKTKASLAWDQLRYNVGRMFVGRPSTVTENKARTDADSHHECVYSSSRFGCLAPGRNAIHLTRKVAHSLKRSVKSMDLRLDHFLFSLTKSLSEDEYNDIDYGFNFNNEYEFNYPDFLDDDDEDILDTLIRVTGAVGVQMGKTGIHAAQLGMKKSRKVAGKVVGKMKDRMGKHSNRWGERMSEQEEVDTFF